MNTGLFGPYPLTFDGIANSISVSLPGTYTLGKMNSTGFAIHYVGRSDDDVAVRLKQWVPKWYPHFFVRCFATAKEAFEKECELYHAFNPPDNSIHPATPQGHSYRCPWCR